jgi:hypothetical protein
MIEIFVQPAFTRLALETVQDLITNNTNKENFNDDNNNLSIGVLLWILFWLLFWFGISIYAVYLSWNCKSNKVRYTITRLFFAFIAWIFGIFYIGIHFMLFNDCNIPAYATT